MQHLHLASTVTIALGMVIVLTSAFGLLPGVWLIAGVGLVLAGMAKAIVFAVWNGITA